MKNPNAAKMTDDVRNMVNRWKRAGYETENLPHDLLVYAMAVAFQHSHDRQNRLDMLMAHTQNVKEKVATDWVHMLEMKRQTGTQFQNDDQHPSLF